MRRTLVLAVLLALSVPLVAVGAVSSGEGTLSVVDGRGKVELRARGATIGRVDRGSILVYDLTPNDTAEPIIVGEDLPVRAIGDGGFLYPGRDIRFRMIGGEYRIIIYGRGINLSVVANGVAVLRGDEDNADTGSYSTVGDDCRAAGAKCKSLPEKSIRVKLGNGLGLDRP